ncbi:MAG: hypothetical protein JZU67_04500, partial [Burkholderiaceae bacterium]|nr:hypothetical protein [Burkholderiaceae bacterium]
MIGLFNKTSEIKGEIGYLGLQDWWLGSFSQQERDYIEKVYQPFGLEPGSKPLTQSEISWSSQTPAGLLCNLAGWFNNPKDREISKKIIEEANVMALLGEAVLDRHFTLQQTMEIYYCE